MPCTSIRVSGSFTESRMRRRASLYSPHAFWRDMLWYQSFITRCSELREDLGALRERLFRLREAEPQHPVRRRLAVEGRERDGGEPALLRQAHREIHVLLLAHGVVAQVLEEG